MDREYISIVIVCKSIFLSLSFLLTFFSYYLVSFLSVHFTLSLLSLYSSLSLSRFISTDAAVAAAAERIKGEEERHLKNGERFSLREKSKMKV